MAADGQQVVRQSSLTPEERAHNCLAFKVDRLPCAATARTVCGDVEDRIAAAIRAAVAEEREACAKELDREREGWTDDTVYGVLETMAEAIRARQ